MSTAQLYFNNLIIFVYDRFNISSMYNRDSGTFIAVNTCLNSVAIVFLTKVNRYLFMLLYLVVRLR